MPAQPPAVPVENSAASPPVETPAAPPVETKPLVETAAAAETKPEASRLKDVRFVSTKNGADVYVYV